MNLIDQGNLKIILCIDEQTNLANKITRKTGMTFAWVSKALNKLFQEKIIKYVEQKDKRSKPLELTPKGKRIQKVLFKLKELE